MAAQLAVDELASALGLYASVKYVPPPVAEVPRRRRAPAGGPPVLPVPGQRNVLVTSALPYVNNVPHLGNLIGCVLSGDVYARYQRQRGVNCVYICGTDEYGTATETKAAEEGLTPREVCDKYHAQHAAIYSWFDIAFDHFGRTSCAEPWATPDWPQTVIAQDIFAANQANGNVREDTVEQVFCLGCAKFLADRFIEGVCPHCAYDDARGDQCDKCGKLLNATELLAPRCKADGAHGVEVRTSQHLFLDLPKLEPALRAWIARSAREGAWTANSIAITESWLAAGLKPRCITRDLKWGTPVPHPGYENKVFYVWFDAPIGYVSITANYTPEWRQWWQNPRDVSLYQFMGKDNIPFHTVIFPASLLGTSAAASAVTDADAVAGAAAPPCDWSMLHHVSTTEYLNYEAGKFSKSRGVGVFGDAAQGTGIPSEVWRYYLLANRPEVSDSVFTWGDFADKNNNELLKNVGNLVQRALSLCFAQCGGCIPAPAASLDARDLEAVAAIDAALRDYLAAMDAVRLKAGLKAVMDLSAEGNKYMQDTKPWELAKVAPERAATVLHTMCRIIRLLAAVAEPFMPGFTDKVLHLMDLPHAGIPDCLAGLEAIPPAHPLSGKPTPLFSAITAEQVEALRAQFGGSQADQAAAAAVAGGAGAAPAGGAPAAAATVATGGGGKAAAKGGKKPAAAAAGPSAEGPTPEQVDADPLAACDIRVGVITKAWVHPTADKLYCEEIDLGEGVPRQIASGLRAHYTLEQMQGRRVTVIANLKPRALVGFMSAGMVLCATAADSTVHFVSPPEGAPPGERVVFAGHGGVPAADPKLMDKKKVWDKVAPGLRVDDGGLATWEGVPFGTSAGPCSALAAPGAPIR